MTRLLLLLVTLAAALCGCRKPLPSPDFIAASSEYSNVVATQGNDGYFLPDMEEVLARLARVSEKSSDYAAARALIETIAKERARITADKAAAAKLFNTPVPMPSAPQAAAPPPEPEAALPAAAVAKAPEDSFARGASWAPLQAKFFGCIIPSGTISLSALDGGAPTDLDAFELYDSADCRKKIPALVQSVALIQDGRIKQLSPKSAIKQVEAPAPPPGP